jgi:SNF2 family DNA or RNA helicase
VQSLQGSDPAPTRQSIVDQWSSPEGEMVLLISTVGMTGINLSAARIMILFVNIAPFHLSCRSTSDY